MQNILLNKKGYISLNKIKRRFSKLSNRDEILRENWNESGQAQLGKSRNSRVIYEFLVNKWQTRLVEKWMKLKGMCL